MELSPDPNVALSTLVTNFNFHKLPLPYISPTSRSFLLCFSSALYNSRYLLHIVHSFQSSQAATTFYSLNQRLSSHLIDKMKFSATVVALALAGSAVAVPQSWSDPAYTSSSYSSSSYSSSSTSSSTVWAYPTTTPSSSKSYSSSSTATWGSWDPYTSSSSSYSSSVSYTTTVVNSLTTFCPFATTITHGPKTYTVTAATTLTITDCPCTISLPVYTSTSVACSTWYELFTIHS
jgi:hypothetical protein